MAKHHASGRDQVVANDTEDGIFRKIFRDAVDPMMLVGSDYRVLDCNQAALQKLGISDKAKIVGLHASDFSPAVQPDGRNSEEKASESMAALLRDTGGKHRFA